MKTFVIWEKKVNTNLPEYMTASTFRWVSKIINEYRTDETELVYQIIEKVCDKENKELVDSMTIWEFTNFCKQIWEYISWEKEKKK